MSIQAIATPAGFIVEGSPCPGPPYHGFYGPGKDRCLGTQPPYALIDAIGKSCETCGGNRRVAVWDMARRTKEPCLDSCGACVVDGEPTGLASVELTVPYDHEDYGPGTITVRVIPDEVLLIDGGRALMLFHEHPELGDPADLLGRYLLTGSVVK